MRGLLTRNTLVFGLVSVCLVGHVAWQQRVCPQQEEHTRESEKELWLLNGSHIFSCKALAATVRPTNICRCQHAGHRRNVGAGCAAAK